MDLLKGSSSPSPETLLPVDVREKTASGIQSTNANRQSPKPAKKMAYLRRTVMALILCMLVLLGLASAGAPRVRCHIAAADQQTATATSESFADMLKSASPASLHELLHRYFPGRFQDGVFESEHKAMEAVHRANAPLATSIVQLAKRDETNSTTTGGTSPPPATETTTSEPPVDSTTSTSAPQTTTTTTTTSSSSTSSSSSSTSVPPPSTSSVPPRSTSSSPSPSSTSTPRSSSPPGTSSTPSSSGPGTTSSSRRPTLPSSSIPGDTTLTTSTIPPGTTTPPPQTSKPVVTTLTSTSPNGVVVTVIATTYVPGDAGGAVAPTSTRTPSLQNAAVSRHSGGSVLAGVVALAMLFIVV